MFQNLAPHAGMSVAALIPNTQSEDQINATAEDSAVENNHGTPIRGRFICSHCGAVFHRTVYAFQQLEQHTVAYFCSQKCGRQNRLGGLAVLTSEKQAATLSLHDHTSQGYREIADMLNLSPLAVEAYLRDRYQPIPAPRTSAAMFPSTIPKKRPGRKPKPVEPEDDIFAD